MTSFYKQIFSQNHLSLTKILILTMKQTFKLFLTLKKYIVILNRKEDKINDKIVYISLMETSCYHQFEKELILEDSSFAFFTYKLSICLCSGLLLPDFFISKCFSCFFFVYRLFLQQGLCLTFDF